ncbi:MAG: GIY-YIG nuclease family protein, partial [bacterium]|nr:GIY-YIG nuclease family protein [bacterium]
MKIKLTELEVLVLDCQATGANPERGHLLEMGWARTGGSQGPGTDGAEITSCLFKLPDDVKIPRRVTGVTGLKSGDMADGLPSGEVWEKLVATAGDIAGSNGSVLCPTVIHFARYEEPFLHFLHSQFGEEGKFPFEIICTYQVIRRLFPNIPSKGLRAAAGYLGYSVPEFRRSAHHITANVFIWRKVVELLEREGIVYLDDLKEWLAKPCAPTKKSGREFLMEAALRLSLPHKPGVYRMLRSNGDLLYIGKATSLKQRVNSYFYKGKNQARKTGEMLTQAGGLEVTVTASALEAALLETDEIKEHSPPYNVALQQRDRKLAFFSRDLVQASEVADEEFPVGPFPSRESFEPAALIIELLGAGVTGKGSAGHTGPVDWDDPDLPSRAMGSLPEYAPEMECFREGFQLFREQYSDMLRRMEYSSVFKRNPLGGLM